jgi:nicotinamide mononucleotide transporter
MNTLDIIGAIIGLFFIVSEYRADRWFWPLSLLMSAFYIVIDFSSGIYANGALCCYNFVMSLYGLLVWRGILGKRDNEDRPTTSCPRHYWPWLILAALALSGLFFWLLTNLNERLYENVAPEVEFLLDSLTAGISIVGMFMVSQKWWQQWICWIIVNPMTVLLFYFSGNYASALLYVVFCIFCVLGIIRWKKESIS